MPSASAYTHGMLIAPASTIAASAATITALAPRASSSTARAEKWSTTAPPISMNTARGTAMVASTRPSAPGSPVSLSTSQGRATRVNWSPNIDTVLPPNSRRKLVLRESAGCDMGSSQGKGRDSAARGGGVPRTVGQLQQVLAHIGGPVGGELIERGALTAPERARGFLEAGQIASQRAHRAVGRFAGLARLLLGAASAARLLHQPAQRHRGATGLAAQPVPVARQQGHLAGDHAQLRPSGSARRSDFGGRAQARQHLIHAAAQVELQRVAGGVIENQRRLGAPLVHRAAHRLRYVLRRAGGDASMAFEGGAAGAVGGGHDRVRWSGCRI